MTEDHTVAALKGIPIFCLGRDYEVIEFPALSTIIKRYSFLLKNRMSAIVLDIRDGMSDLRYELSILEPYRDSNGTGEVTVSYCVVGNEDYVHEILSRYN